MKSKYNQKGKQNISESYSTKEINKYVKESFKKLLADEDKMKYLAYTTQIMPSIIKLLNEQRKELIKEGGKAINQAIINRRNLDIEEFEKMIKEIRCFTMLEYTNNPILNKDGKWISKKELLKELKEKK
jgi:hypothetical protein